MKGWEALGRIKNSGDQIVREICPANNPKGNPDP